MPKMEDIQHSLLIVSSSEQFETLIRKGLPLRRFSSVECCKNSASARRFILERYVDLVIVNLPLQDEPGLDFVLDISEQCNASVLIVTPSDMFEEVLDRVTDKGMLVIPRPVSVNRIIQGLRLLIAVQNRYHRFERELASVREKTEELRIVSRAKILLVQKRGLSEDDAHRFIGKFAMDCGVSRKIAAERIIEDLE
ncbi:MAG: ANTAR domain-containing protein [Lachnospiraceae bacterium]|nr:ANTAR domain-containing protein [Lachnospiraceae bacterium]